jgi:hypothetical protein
LFPLASPTCRCKIFQSDPWFIFSLKPPQSEFLPQLHTKTPAASAAPKRTHSTLVWPPLSQCQPSLSLAALLSRGILPHFFLNTSNVSTFLIVALITAFTIRFSENNHTNSATKYGITAASYVFPPSSSACVLFQARKTQTHHISSHHHIHSLRTLPRSRPPPFLHPHHAL